MTGRGAVVIGRIAGLPDIDRLEGYDSEMECDPPADYYDAYARNEQNIVRLHNFIAGYLADTGRDGIQIDQVVCVLCVTPAQRQTPASPLPSPVPPPSSRPIVPPRSPVLRSSFFRPSFFSSRCARDRRGGRRRQQAARARARAGQ